LNWTSIQVRLFRMKIDKKCVVHLGHRLISFFSVHFNSIVRIQQMKKKRYSTTQLNSYKKLFTPHNLWWTFSIFFSSLLIFIFSFLFMEKSRRWWYNAVCISLSRLDLRSFFYVLWMKLETFFDPKESLSSSQIIFLFKLIFLFYLN
jgi:hypothetical protein